MKHLLHYPGFRFVIIVDESGVGGRVGMVRVLRLNLSLPSLSAALDLRSQTWICSVMLNVRQLPPIVRG